MWTIDRRTGKEEWLDRRIFVLSSGSQCAFIAYNFVNIVIICRSSVRSRLQDSRN
jgi:hypothetical protein